MRLVIALGTCVVVAGCATAPAPEAPTPLPATPPAVVVPACPVCVDRSDEIARLQDELARRDAELRDLRASQREQARMAQASTREVTRAKARMRRLATQADAASYLAEVEVSLQSARGGAKPSPSSLVDLAQAFLTAATATFAEGDYATAMERAGHAEQLLAAATHTGSTGKRIPPPGKVLLQPGIPVATTGRSMLRASPQARSRVAATLRKDEALVAHATQEGWMRVATADGKVGWVRQRELAAR